VRRRPQRPCRPQLPGRRAAARGARRRISPLEIAVISRLEIAIISRLEIAVISPLG